MSLEPGSLKLYFNGFTLVNLPKSAYERERLLISIYSRDLTYQHVMADHNRQISAWRTDLQERSSHQLERMAGPHGWPFTPCLLAEKPARKKLKTDSLVSVLL